MLWLLELCIKLALLAGLLLHHLVLCKGGLPWHRHSRPIDRSRGRDLKKEEQVVVVKVEEEEEEEEQRLRDQHPFFSACESRVELHKWVQLWRERECVCCSRNFGAIASDARERKRENSQTVLDLVA